MRPHGGSTAEAAAAVGACGGTPAVGGEVPVGLSKDLPSSTICPPREQKEQKKEQQAA